MKRRRRNLIEFMLLQCLLYLLMQQQHVTQARCTWGSWLPWNCSCCGGAVQKDVYRVRAKCCDNTYECVNLRYVAQIIKDENEFEEKGSCQNDCGKLFGDYNPHTCVSSKMSLDDVKGPGKVQSCNDLCVGVWSSTTPLTTPTSPSTSSVTNRTATPNRSPPSRANGNTLTTAKSTPGVSSTVSYKSSSNVENIEDPNDTNYARCSWGSWLPWDCSCCGGSDESDVYRIRNKCCDYTYECVNLRYAAQNIRDGNKFEEKGSCLNDCGKQFSNHNPHPCTSSKITLDEVTEQNRIKSCNDVCIGTLSTTRTTKTTFAAKPTTTKVSRGPTLQNVSSQTIKIFRGDENGTITTRNGHPKTSITSSLQTGSSVKDTTIFPGDVTVHVSKRMTPAKTSVTYPSSSKFQTGYTVSSENNTSSIGWIIGGVIGGLVVLAICICACISIGRKKRQICKCLT